MTHDYLKLNAMWGNDCERVSFEIISGPDACKKVFQNHFRSNVSRSIRLLRTNIEHIEIELSARKGVILDFNFQQSRKPNALSPLSERFEIP